MAVRTAKHLNPNREKKEKTPLASLFLFGSELQIQLNGVIRMFLRLFCLLFGTDIMF